MVNKIAHSLDGLINEKGDDLILEKRQFNILFDLAIILPIKFLLNK